MPAFLRKGVSFTRHRSLDVAANWDNCKIQFPQPRERRSTTPLSTIPWDESIGRDERYSAGRNDF